jgi:hypothetical protein
MAVNPTLNSNPVPLTTSVPKASSNTINGGTNVGNVFSGGTDFRDPDTIGGKVDDFSGSIKPVSSNTLTGKLTSTNPLGKNPDPGDILGSVNGSLNGILGRTFNVNVTVPVFTNFALPVPDLGHNPDPTKITVFTDFFARSIQPITTAEDPRNANPLMWHNPSASSILLGSLGASGTVLSGGSLQFPAFNPFPNQGSVNFGNLSGGSASVFPVFPSMTTLFPPAANFGGFGGFGLGQGAMFGGFSQNLLFGQSFGQSFTQPFGLPMSAPVQDYGSQVSLLAYLNDLTSVLSTQLRQLVDLSGITPAGGNS